MPKKIPIDSILDNFIRDYPFFSDPIFLFNPDVVPEKESLLANIQGIRYPNIEKAQAILHIIKQRFIEVQSIFENTIFENDEISMEYENRIQGLEIIIRLIEIFYVPDETEKFNLINSYYGIDLTICDHIIGDGGKYAQDEISLLQVMDQNMDMELFIEELHASEVKKYFEQSLLFLGLQDNWKVELSNTVLAIVHGDFNPNGGVIYIPREYTTTYRRLLALIIHEIDGHCRQFDYRGQYAIFGPGIRSSHSEDILEGLAVYLEHSWNRYIFGENSVENSLSNFSLKYSLFTKKISLKQFFELQTGKSYFRLFRGFSDISHFVNSKDFVYLQGLYKIISFKNTYGLGIFDMLYSEGVINEKYIKNNIHKYNTSKYTSVEDLLMSSSAFFILNQILHDKK